MRNGSGVEHARPQSIVRVLPVSLRSSERRAVFRERSHLSTIATAARSHSHCVHASGANVGSKDVRSRSHASTRVKPGLGRRAVAVRVEYGPQKTDGGNVSKSVFPWFVRYRNVGYDERIRGLQKQRRRSDHVVRIHHFVVEHHDHVVTRRLEVGYLAVVQVLVDAAPGDGSGDCPVDAVIDTDGSSG